MIILAIGFLIPYRPLVLTLLIFLLLVLTLPVLILLVLTRLTAFFGASIILPIILSIVLLFILPIFIVVRTSILVTLTVSAIL